MIVQGILDFLSQAIAKLIGLIPPLPAEWNDQLVALSDGGNYIGALVAKFGPFIPFGTVTSLLSIWVGLLTFWLAMLGLRLVLWLLGR